MFEFDHPKSERRKDNFEYWKTGIFHFCVTDPDIEGITARIVDNGGKLRTRIWQIVPDKPYKLAYCEDPWGNIVEVYTHSYEQIWSTLG